MKRGPLEVIKFKTAAIPIYSDLHHGKQTFLIAYYADDARKRERFKTFDEARRHAKAKAEELAKGTAHVAAFTAEETATINGAINYARCWCQAVAGSPRIRGSQKNSRRASSDSRCRAHSWLTWKS